MPQNDIPVDRLVELIAAQAGAVIALYLFGSVAADAQRPDSDIDLAMLVEKPLTELQRWSLAQDLAVELGKNVDLIDLRSASTVLRSQILHASHKLYVADAAVVAKFEDFIVGDYARLNEERAGILADIAERGSVHSG